MKFFLAFVLLSVATAKKKRALLVIDVQDCFMEAAGTASGKEGSLAVAATAELIPIINQIREEKSCLFDLVIRSQDFHPPNHISFGPTHGLAPFAHLQGLGELPITCVHPFSGAAEDASCCPSYYIDPYDCTQQLCPNRTAVTDDAGISSLNFALKSAACSVCKDTPQECFNTTQAMWTNHCLQTGDSSFAPKLMTQDTDVIVQKGGNPYVDSYSAFMDNTRKLKTKLDGIFREEGIEEFFLVGIATDYCVYFSAVDGIELGYTVHVVLDATRGIAEDTIEAAKVDMTRLGVNIINTTDLLAMECPAPTSAVGGAFSSSLAAGLTVAAASFAW